MGQRILLVTLLLLPAFLLPHMVEDSLVERTGSLHEPAKPAFSSTNSSVSPSEGWTTSGQTLTEGPSKAMNGQINPANGYEWLEHPEGSGIHYMQAQKSDDWSRWQG